MNTSICSCGCLPYSAKSPRSISSMSSSPFALCNLLQAGTVQIELNSKNMPCYHTHVEDGWHLFNEVDLNGMVQASSEHLLESLQFLTRQQLTVATSCVNNVHLEMPSLVVRIYLVPYDLPGMNGRLSYHARKRENAQGHGLARRHMSILLPQIRRDQLSWSFGTADMNQNPPSILSNSTDREQLAEIYANIPSPTPGKLKNSSSLVSRLLDPGDGIGESLGLRSLLLRYQRESVATMLEREEHAHLSTPNPLYLTLKTVDGSIFYYQPGTTEILRENSMVSLPPGGVLCEELGTGKTLIILALVLGTMKQLSKPEESVIDTRPVLTPLAFQRFPSGEISSLRERFPRKAKMTEVSSESRVPSFRELLLHQLCSNPDVRVPDTSTATGVALKERQRHLFETFDLPAFEPLRKLQKENLPFYFHFQDDYTLTDFRTSDRGRDNPGPRVMYLSVATLIVVPPNLISQWDREIHKHCKEMPRVLIVRSNTVLPLARDLAANYDIILITYSRFCDEDRKANIANAHTWKLCKCFGIEDPCISPQPKCRCKPPDISSLLQIRWKRLVIDEGHISSSLSTRFTPFAQQLSVQARWIVTGTPTTNLLGLSFGESGTEEIKETLMHPQSLSELGDACSLLNSARIWNASDNRDITKLMTMISQFIGVKFLADGQVIRTHIKDALFTEKGPLPGGVDMLVQIMREMMIRHQISDVEKEITLPKLTQESVLLDLDPLMTISYNALQAGIALNAIDSERKDRDYLFHPTNAEYLQLTVKNMSQLMFWSVDSKLYNIKDIVKQAEELLSKVKEGKKDIPEHDVVQVRRVLKHSRIASENNLWNLIQMHEYVPYHVINIPLPILKEWSRLPDHLIHADRLLQLQQRVHRCPLSDEVQLCSFGREIGEIDVRHRLILEELTQKKGKRKEKEKKSAFPVVSSDLKTRTAKKKASSNDRDHRIREMRRDLQASLARLDALEENGSPAGSSSLKIKIPASMNQNSILLHQSPVAHAHVQSTASSKLNYILEEVQKHSVEEKFLIFSDSPLTLSHIHEALNLLQIKNLQFTSQTSALEREQLVLTFETSTTYRVFLMELKHGARGLNLVSASRVIFCEPVWQADVESQAIKRAHRIGQVKPVTVKTLVIRGTAEEKMMERRQQLKSIPGKAPKLLEEAGMRHFIANPEFIESHGHPGVPTPRGTFPLFRLPHLNESSPQITTSHKRVRLEDPIQSSDTAQRNRKTVRFV
ncbi:SNF2 family N-terminal domain-containing protein [Lentinula edodes]|uniref:SNF2 family N-terminal domain-containing protein n=1 Tax=Lentinula lateritia TaxID=40482 RepID=A0A9W9DT52_9AGAR|nr:SNF2 family N-terminal domain-containing protein [Lentinula edodes]